MKVKLFSHSDLDGVGCIILGKLAFGNNLDYEICNYDDVNEKVKVFYLGEEINNYDKIFITDISVNDEVAKIIESCYIDETINPSTQLLDHHPTALDLNKYDWCNVVISDEIEKVSGTSLFYNYLNKNNIFKIVFKTDKEEDYEDVFSFVEKVKRYDTWLWKEKYNDTEAKQLNDLLYIYGKDKFIDKYFHTLEVGGWYDNSKSFLDRIDKLFLELEQNKIDKYIESKDKQIIVKDIQGYKAGVVFGEQYHSELGNKLCELHPELDFIVIINMAKSISYRTTKDNIDLGKDVAKIYGGGGHPKASGSEISDEIRENVLKKIFY